MYEQYGKMKEPRRYKNREQEDTIGFFDMMNGKHVEAKHAEIEKMRKSVTEYDSTHKTT